MSQKCVLVVAVDLYVYCSPVTAQHKSSVQKHFMFICSYISYCTMPLYVLLLESPTAFVQVYGSLFKTINLLQNLTSCRA